MKCENPLVIFFYFQMKSNTAKDINNPSAEKNNENETKG